MQTEFRYVKRFRNKSWIRHPKNQSRFPFIMGQNHQTEAAEDNLKLHTCYHTMLYTHELNGGRISYCMTVSHLLYQICRQAYLSSKSPGVRHFKMEMYIYVFKRLSRFFMMAIDTYVLFFFGHFLKLDIPQCGQSESRV